MVARRVGQRRGIRVPSNTDHEAYVVVGKRAADRALLVAFDHPEVADLYTRHATAAHFSWINRAPAGAGDFLYPSAIATDGRDGLLKLQTDPGIRLVLSDINMPHMDGLTMAEKIRNDLGNRDVRIVMLTTEDNPNMRARGKAIGVTGWIVKPFRGEAVLGPFRKFCDMA